MRVLHHAQKSCRLCDVGMAQHVSFLPQSGTIMALQRTGHTLMIWSRLSKWLLPSVNIIQPGCWSCHQHSKAASAISATYSKDNNLVH